MCLFTYSYMHRYLHIYKLKLISYAHKYLYTNIHRHIGRYLCMTLGPFLLKPAEGCFHDEKQKSKKR